MGVVMSQAFGSRNPISQMNRRQRRRHMRELGYTWAQARAIAKRKEEADAQEARLAASASRLTPEQARRALAEWAARGGK